VDEPHSFIARWRAKFDQEEAARAFVPVATYDLVAVADDYSAAKLRERVIEELYAQFGGDRWGVDTDRDFTTGDRIVHFHMRDITLAAYFAIKFLDDHRIAQVTTAPSAKTYL
jgi:hypothetical protein